jgi:hypothetical protein
MTIDAVWCTIHRDNPTITGSPHPVSFRVTDGECRAATVSWTITVTSSGFRLPDAVNGSPSALFSDLAQGVSNVVAAQIWHDQAYKALIEDNIFNQIGLPQVGWGSADALSPKEGIQGWFIRANHIYDTAWHGINFIHENNSSTRNNPRTIVGLSLRCDHSFRPTPSRALSRS